MHGIDIGPGNPRSTNGSNADRAGVIAVMDVVQVQGDPVFTAIAADQPSAYVPCGAPSQYVKEG